MEPRQNAATQVAAKARYRDLDPSTSEERPSPMPTEDLTPDQLQQLDRLRARMGFIDASGAMPRLINDRYEVLRTLGYGGMGVVYRVHDRALDSDRVALKLVRYNAARDVAVEQARLRDEARRLAQLRDDPHVITVHDVGTHQGASYLTMEYVDGSDLRRWCEETRPTRTQILHAYLGAARGLQAAHDIGLVHRDFKPDNVLIDGQGIAKVADFGVAAAMPEELAETVDGDPTHTAVCGTVKYMAPEQMAGERPDARSDQFSFCVALWESLTGAAPYEWHDAASQKAALAGAPARAERVPRWLRRTLLKGMAAIRSQRFGDMRAIVEQIERGLDRPRKLAWAGGVALGVIGLGILVAFIAAGSPSEEAQTCEDFVAQAEQHWGAAQREALERRRAEAPEAVDWALARLDGLIGRWTITATAACDEERAPLIGAERTCLEDWLGSLDGAVELLTERGDRQTLIRAPDLLERLTAPGGDFCAIERRPTESELAELVDKARGAAVLGERDVADALSLAALERAELLAGERAYTPERAEAHAARAEVLHRSNHIDEALEQLATAEEQAIGSKHFEVLARIRIAWIGLVVAYQDGRGGELEATLRRVRPLLAVAELGDDALIHGELLEAQALVDEQLGRLDAANRGHIDAAAFFERVGYPLLAARSINNYGSIQRQLGYLDKAEAAHREVLALLAGEGMSPGYHRLLTTRFNLAAVLFDRYHVETNPDRSSQLAQEAFAELQPVIDFGSRGLRLDALALASSWAAEIGDHERVRTLTEQALRELEANPDVDRAFADDVLVRVVVAQLVAVGGPDAEAQVHGLLERGEELDVELLSGLLQTWVTYLEHSGRCAEARAVLERVPSRDRLAGLKEFDLWLAARSDSDCLQNLDHPTQLKGDK
jgi:tRNA A-37 threonylcarbamoyl transferase component Bud32/tetratricopeptide (TPR) repeat protein